MPSPYLTRDDVFEAYGLFFDRNPESESAIEAAIASHRSLTDLWRTLLESPEFARIRSRGQYEHRFLLDAIAETQALDLSKVETVVTDEMMEQLLARTRAQWTALGATDPHWSVLAQEEYRSDNLAASSLDHFYASGAADAKLLALVERRSGRPIGPGICVELGCGVGRITTQLAERFEKVVGIDISPSILELCRSHLDQKRISNVKLVQVVGIEDFERLDEFDFFYSIIVFQHNTPPVQRRMLATFLRKIRRGGAALLQIVTDIPDYEFKAIDYLNSKPAEIEMHAIPMSVVLSTIRESGMDVIDLMDDGSTGRLGSKTIYAARP